MRAGSATALGEREWTDARAAHVERVHALLGDYVARRRRGEKHPVLDFLFTYFGVPAGHLLRWSPGYGVILTGPTTHELVDGGGFIAYPQSGPDAVRVDPALLVRRRETAEFVHALTTATATQVPVLGCFGLHEWAMVYRADPAEIRHPLPLRLGSAGTDAVVEALPLRCTHFDAFRFFTPDAAPRNESTLTRAGQIGSEQPGCLHANMDLYKWCAKLGPLVDAELRLDCFAVALTARELDMRAGPYDLTQHGYEPIEIDTAAGRAEYVRLQISVAKSAATLRDRLAQKCRELLTAVPELGPTTA